MEFDEDELKSYYAYKKSEYKETTNQKAIKLIKSLVRFHYLLKVRKPQYKFLYEDLKYDVQSFVNWRRTTNISSSNNLIKFVFDVQEKTKLIRFYNKLFCFITIQGLCKDFYNSQRMHKCYLPSSDERMHNFISNIDETYIRLNDLIECLQVAGNEFKCQLEQSENNLKRLIRVSQLQNVIGKYFLRRNNMYLMKRNGRTLIPKITFKNSLYDLNKFESSN